MKKLFFILMTVILLISCNKGDDTVNPLIGSWDEIEHTQGGSPVADLDAEPEKADLIISSTKIFDKGYILEADYTYDGNKISYMAIVGPLSYTVTFDGVDMEFLSSDGEYRKFQKR